MVLIATRDEILMELQKMWGEQWAITLDIVGGRPDVFDMYPNGMNGVKGYIERSNNLVRILKGDADGNNSGDDR